MCEVYVKTFTISTSKRFEALNITHLVEQAVEESRIKNGIVIIHAPHATAAVVLNEYEPRIANDYLEWVRRYVPPGGGWRHDEIDDNAHAHIASAIIGSTRVLPLKDGRLLRGTWQEVILLEFDGPRSRRRVVVEVIGCK